MIVEFNIDFLFIDQLQHHGSQNIGLIQTTGEESSVIPGFYGPEYREDGDPLQDEERLRSFTHPLPGWEEGRRVAVALHPVNAASYGQVLFTSTTVSPKVTSNIEDFRDLPFLQLRETASDLAPRKSRRNRSRRPHLHLQVPQKESSLASTTENAAMFYPESSPSSSRTTNSFGAIGDGRFPASPLHPSLSTAESTHGSGQPENGQSKSSTTVEPTISDAFDTSSLNAGLFPTRNVDENARPSTTNRFEIGNTQSRQLFGIHRLPQRRRSFTILDLLPPKHTSLPVLRRVSRPIASMNQMYGSHDEHYATQPPPNCEQPPPMMGTDSFMTTPIWEREGPPFRSRTVHSEDPSNILLDPKSFALPYEVSISLKHQSTHRSCLGCSTSQWFL